MNVAVISEQPSIVHEQSIRVFVGGRGAAWQRHVHAFGHSRSLQSLKLNSGQVVALYCNLVYYFIVASLIKLVSTVFPCFRSVKVFFHLYVLYQVSFVWGTTFFSSKRMPLEFPMVHFGVQIQMDVQASWPSPGNLVVSVLKQALRLTCGSGTP